MANKTNNRKKTNKAGKRKKKTPAAGRIRRVKMPNSGKRSRAPQKHAQGIRGGLAVRLGSKPAILLAQAMTLPANVSNLRLVTTPGEVAATACATVHRETDVTIPGVAGTYESTFPGGSYFYALFRDPLRYSIRLLGNPTHSEYSYEADFYNETTKKAGTSEKVTIGIDYKLCPTRYAAARDYAPHGDFLYCGADAPGNYYVWLDSGAKLYVEATGASILDSMVATQWVNGAPQNMPLIPYDHDNSWFRFTCETQGYYAFAMRTPTASTLTAISLMYMIGNGDVMSHQTMPGFEDVIPNVAAYRINSCAVQFTDVAALLNRGGRIHGAWCDGAVNWWDRTTTAKILTNGSVQTLDYDTLPAEKGAYAYLKAKKSEDLNFRNNISLNEAKVISDACWPIDDKSAYLVLRIDIASSGADALTVAPGMDFVVREYSCLEYQTPSMVFERHLAETNYQDFCDMMGIVRTMPVFHENPTHFEAFKRAARGAYNMLRIHGGGIVGLMSKMFPQMAPFAPAVGLAAGALPEW